MRSLVFSFVLFLITCVHFPSSPSLKKRCYPTLQDQNPFPRFISVSCSPPFSSFNFYPRFLPSHSHTHTVKELGRNNERVSAPSPLIFRKEKWEENGGERGVFSVWSGLSTFSPNPVHFSFYPFFSQFCTYANLAGIDIEWKRRRWGWEGSGRIRPPKLPKTPHKTNPLVTQYRSLAQTLHSISHFRNIFFFFETKKHVPVNEHIYLFAICVCWFSAFSTIQSAGVKVILK